MSRGQTGATGVLFGLVLVASGSVAFWYHDASKFADEETLDFGRRSFLPAVCTITSPKDGDIRETAEAYFYGGNARLDLVTDRPGVVSGHEIRTDKGILYGWQNGASHGLRVRYDAKENTRSGFAEPSWWICKPWWSPDSTKFIPPRGVQFAQP